MGFHRVPMWVSPHYPPLLARRALYCLASRRRRMRRLHACHVLLHHFQYRSACGCVPAFLLVAILDQESLVGTGEPSESFYHLPIVCQQIGLRRNPRNELLIHCGHVNVRPIHHAVLVGTLNGDPHTFAVPSCPCNAFTANHVVKRFAEIKTHFLLHLVDLPTCPLATVSTPFHQY